MRFYHLLLFFIVFFNHVHADGITIDAQNKLVIPYLINQFDGSEMQAELSFYPLLDGMAWQVDSYTPATEPNNAIRPPVLMPNLELLVPEIQVGDTTFSANLTPFVWQDLTTEQASVILFLKKYKRLAESGLSDDSVNATLSDGTTVSAYYRQFVDSEGNNGVYLSVAGSVANSEATLAVGLEDLFAAAPLEVVPTDDAQFHLWSATSPRIFLGGVATDINRLPESQQNFINLPLTMGNAYFPDNGESGLMFEFKYQNPSLLRGMCEKDDSDCYTQGEPVLFIHGFTSDGLLTGGTDYWGDFPRLLQEAGYVAFDFTWRTNARFQDVANDLAQAVAIINETTQKPVHLIAHSFGGLLARTWLQGLASDATTPSAEGLVASLTTLGTPHSSIAETDGCFEYPFTASTQFMAFPQGQDPHSMHPSPLITITTSIDIVTVAEVHNAVNRPSFDFCPTLSCEQAGKSIFNAAERELFAISPFEIVAKLADLTSHPLPEIDILVQIGLSSERDDSNLIDVGDGLVTYEGQRFLPTDTLQFADSEIDCGDMKRLIQPLHNKTLLSNGASITETIIGTDLDLLPGDTAPADYQGYRHAATQNVADNDYSFWKSTPYVENKVTCEDQASCDNAVLQTTLAWLEAHKETAIGEDPKPDDDIEPTENFPTFRDCPDCPLMVSLPGATFQMGDIAENPSFFSMTSERPVHEVTVDAFAIGIYEVTNAEYVAFLNTADKVELSGWFGTQSGRPNSHLLVSDDDVYYVEEGFEDYPMIEVSWYGAVAYAEWLTQKTGQLYRLPTEAEWEYAARGGTTTKYWWGNDIGYNQANCKDECGEDFEQAAPVGTFKPNPFGLYEVHGNVWEWCYDWYDSEYYAQSPTDNPTGPSTGTQRVLRGGSFFYEADSLRSARRRGRIPTNLSKTIGFRIAQGQIELPVE